MNKFDQDLYEFIITPENFEAVFELSNNFKVFKDKLIKDFWKKVLSNLEFTAPELKNWKASIEESVPKKGMIYLSHNDYYSDDSDEIDPSVCSGFFIEVSHRIILGVSFNRNIEKLNYEKVRKFAPQILKEGWKLSPLNGWSFPIYKYMDEDFHSYGTLRKILPSEGDYLAREYAERLIAAHIELYPLIEKFGVKFK